LRLWRRRRHCGGDGVEAAMAFGLRYDDIGGDGGGAARRRRRGAVQ
jgi:hypothetical protein